jgi:four helix bundle protein
MQKELLVDKVVNFAHSAIDIYKKLLQQNQYNIANQLLRSATAIGASVFEAQYAESRADFIHKMKIACKESNETRYWFMVSSKIVNIDPATKEDLDAIHKIINKSIITSRNNQK